MNRQHEQIASHTYAVRRSSANNGLPYRQQQQLYEQETDEYDDEWPPPVPRSAIRYTTIDPTPVIKNGNRRYVLHNSPPPQTHRRNTTQSQDDEEDGPPPRRHHRVHWSLIFGVGMVAMLALWVAGNMIITWWNTSQDDWHYGRPRTFQIDAIVGHHDSSSNPSHFVAMNYHSHLQIIEFPGGDTTKARLYPGPSVYGNDTDLVPVTLSFRDVNGDAKPDLIIVVGNLHVVLINDGGQFRLLKPGEQVAPY